MYESKSRDESNNNQDSSPAKTTTTKGGEETVAGKEEQKTQDLFGNKANRTNRKRTGMEPKLHTFDLTLFQSHDLNFSTAFLFISYIYGSLLYVHQFQVICFDFFFKIDDI
jgi:hypothetical protein